MKIHINTKQTSRNRGSPTDIWILLLYPNTIYITLQYANYVPVFIYLHTSSSSFKIFPKEGSHLQKEIYNSLLQEQGERFSSLLGENSGTDSRIFSLMERSDIFSSIKSKVINPNTTYVLHGIRDVRTLISQTDGIQCKGHTGTGFHRTFSLSDIYQPHRQPIWESSDGGYRTRMHAGETDLG